MSAIPPPDERVLFFSAAGTVTRAAFARDVAHARARLAGPSALVNLLDDRGHFTTALCAAVLNGQQTILPSSKAPEAVASAMSGQTDARILRASADLGHQGGPCETSDDLWRDLERAAGRVHVFTSGSTGEPVRHLKEWRNLSGGAAMTDALIRQAGLDPGRTAVLGTTPHQHMYGLEATIFAPLCFDHAVYSGSVFYPADLAQAIGHAKAAGLSEVVLVTSPAHLRYLEHALADAPEVRLVISATAPLSRELACRIEDRGGPELWEIYGSSETGSVAVRRTAVEELWTPLTGFEVFPLGEAWAARAPHVSGDIPLNDAISIEADGRFALLGRLGDMVNIAGKRTSLGALNAALEGAPGLWDGVVLCEHTKGEDLLTIAAVTNPEANMSPAAIRAAVRAHLRQRLDPVLIPRRIVFVLDLPRNATGKVMARSLGDLTVLSQAAE